MHLSIRDLDTPLSLQNKHKMTCGFMFIVLKWGLKKKISLQLFVCFHLLKHRQKHKQHGLSDFLSLCHHCECLLHLIAPLNRIF